MAILETKNLQKTYYSRKVVNNFSLTVHSHEITGLLGPNGAGKTTSFYMIAGLIPVDHGEITLDNELITNLPIHERAKKGICYLPQEASIFRKLTVEDNILAILELRKDLTKYERLNKLEELIADLNLSNITTNKGYSLSGGERRRVEIARTLALHPKFILFDEPFAGIDPIAVIDLKQIIKNLKNKNIGILITDHNVKETLNICEKAYIVSDGQIIANGTPNDIINNNQVRKVYLGEEFRL